MTPCWGVPIKACFSWSEHLGGLEQQETNSSLHFKKTTGLLCGKWIKDKQEWERSPVRKPSEVHIRLPDLGLGISIIFLSPTLWSL